MTPLTADYATVRATVDALRPVGRTAISQSLDAVVLLTDGENTTGVDPMLAAAEWLTNTGSTVVTVCAGECYAALPLVSSRPAKAFTISDSPACSRSSAT